MFAILLRVISPCWHQFVPSHELAVVYLEHMIIQISRDLISTLRIEASPKCCVFSLLPSELVLTNVQSIFYLSNFRYNENNQFVLHVSCIVYSYPCSHYRLFYVIIFHS